VSRRLQKLREQRDLIFNHLQWIEAEIASEQPAATETGGKQKKPDSAKGGPGIEAVAVSETMVEPPSVQDPFEMTTGPSLRNQVRRGCLLYFGLAWLVLAAITGFIYLAYS